MWSTVSRKRKKERKRNDILLSFDLKSKGGSDYPVLDFKNIVRQQKRKTLGNYDSDEEDERFMNADALEVYKRIERQYVKKGNKGEKNYNPSDFINLGMGYDFDDGFIDDSEAGKQYNPLVTIPRKKGFFINKGPVECENIEEAEDLANSAEDEAPQPVQMLKPWESVSRGDRAPAIPGLTRERAPVAPALNKERPPASQINRERAPAIPGLSKERTSTSQSNKEKPRERAPPIPGMLKKKDVLKDKARPAV